MPREQVMMPAFCTLLATSVIEVRLTPSISARNSCVSATMSLAIRALQQPAAESRLDDMQCIAGRGDPRLRQQDFIVLDTHIPDSVALARGFPEL